MPPLRTTVGGDTGPRPTMPQRGPYVPQQPTQGNGVDNNSAQPSSATNGPNRHLARLTPQQAATARGPYVVDPGTTFRRANASRQLFGAGTSTLTPHDTNSPLSNITSRISQEADAAGYTDPRQAVGPYISGPQARANETTGQIGTGLDVKVNSIIDHARQQMNHVIDEFLSAPPSLENTQSIELAIDTNQAIQNLQQNLMLKQMKSASINYLLSANNYRNSS